MSDDKKEQDGTPPLPEEEALLTDGTPPLPEEEALLTEAASLPARPATPIPTLSSPETTPTPSLQSSLSDASTTPPAPPPSISASLESFQEATLALYQDALAEALLSPSAVLRIESKEQFDEAMLEAGDKLVVIDFTASWCGPCQMIAPYFEVLSQRHNARVAFMKVDVDEVPDIADEYDIVAMPTFVFLKNGEKVDEFCGDCPDTLAAKIILLK
nr:thioredoxin H-type-like isoform X2 [Geotrypetes seraphini]XP_033811649.1 thioredoxin H-type-like isoform X2 [Geotrypetes seraphini]XP_033811736.1 thioredoxin H-type-like isoform X2 [Geotrypetes seraphini]